MLHCGGCIKGGYTYCFKGDLGQVILKNNKIVDTCCKDEQSCKQITMAGYTCSNGFADMDQALTMCPFKESACGKPSFDFSQPGETGSISIQGLEPGEVCNYKIKSICGAPGFKVKVSEK